MNIGKLDYLESIELFRKSFEVYLDAFERKAVRLIDREPGLLRPIHSHRTQRLFRCNKGIDAFRQFDASCGCIFHEGEMKYSG